MSSVVFNPEQWGVELGHVHHSESNHSYVAFDTSESRNRCRANHSLDFGDNTMSLNANTKRSGAKAGVAQEGVVKASALSKRREPNPTSEEYLFVLDSEDSYYLHMHARLQQIAESEKKTFQLVPGCVNDHSATSQQQQCAISMEASNCRVVPCMHHFKASAAFRWIIDNRSCPVCRARIDDIVPMHNFCSAIAINVDPLKSNGEATRKCETIKCELLLEAEVTSVTSVRKIGWVDCQTKTAPPSVNVTRPPYTEQNTGGGCDTSSSHNTSRESEAILHSLVRSNSFSDTYDLQMVGGSCSEVIGRGSFAEVLKGSNKRTGLPVAVKVISEKMVNTKGVTEMVKKESKLQRRVQMDCDHVADVLDDFHEDGQILIVMEFANCGSLEERLCVENARYQPMKFNVAKHYIRHILRALDTAHKRGVVHADIKPENILLFHPDHSMQRDDYHASVHSTDIDVEVVAKLW
jgi:hypothetical protein